MRDYGSPTAKRHLGYSNARVVEKLYAGYLTRSGQRKLQKPKGKKVKTVKHYRDKQGKVRFCGTPYLKKSQQDPQVLAWGQLLEFSVLMSDAFGPWDGKCGVGLKTSEAFIQPPKSSGPNTFASEPEALPAVPYVCIHVHMHMFAGPTC